MKSKSKKCKDGKKYNTGGAVGLGAAPAAFKRGGKVVKAGGKVSSVRPDKKSRGKTMTPSSPLSGAEPKVNRSGFSSAAKVDKENN